MEVINNFLKLLTKENIILYSFKPLALIFCFFYLLFTIVILKQTQVMNKTVNTKGAFLIYLISFFQFFLVAFIFLLAILIL